MSLTVYYREGCHLCEQMMASLHRLQQQMDFAIQTMDIDEDDSLRKRYEVDVPVVALKGEVICFHFFEEDIIKQAIQNGVD